MGVAVAVVENEAAETPRAPRAPGPADGGPPARGDGGLSRRMRWIFAVAALLVVALVVSLIVRPIGAYFTPVDGWGVDALELTMGALCIARYFEGSWRSSSPVARLFPLVIGLACLAWGLGDVAITIESLGGATPSVPSAADALYVCFFPLCFVSFALLIRRGNKSSLVATSLDGLIACLGVAAVSAAFVVAAVIRVTGGGTLAAVTGLTYPLGDILLLALAIGGFAVLPRGFRPFFAIAGVALAANAIGDGFNLLQPMSRFGYVANGAAWPISLTLLALAVWILPANIEHPGTDRIAGFEIARLRRRHRHGDPAPRQLRAHGEARHRTGDADPPRGRRAAGPDRARGARGEDGAISVAHRQDLGPHRRDRGRTCASPTSPLPPSACSATRPASSRAGRSPSSCTRTTHPRCSPISSRLSGDAEGSVLELRMRHANGE